MCMTTFVGAGLKGIDSVAGTKLYEQSGAKQFNHGIQQTIQKTLYPTLDTQSPYQGPQQVQTVSAQQRRDRSLLSS